LSRIIIAGAFLTLISGLPSALAQTARANPRETIVLRIKAYAAPHVENKVPMKTELVVDLFRANAVGLSSQDIAQIYEEEYADT
jgi:hypothetical protein